MRAGSSRVLETNYVKPPRELAGKWVAWSRDGRIVASNETLASVMDHVEREGIKGVSFERLPRLGRSHSH